MAKTGKCNLLCGQIFQITKITDLVFLLVSRPERTMVFHNLHTHRGLTHRIRDSGIWRGRESCDRGKKKKEKGGGVRKRRREKKQGKGKKGSEQERK